jgi:hypothetical protein
MVIDGLKQFSNLAIYPCQKKSKAFPESVEESKV